MFFETSSVTHGNSKVSDTALCLDDTPSVRPVLNGILKCMVGAITKAFKFVSIQFHVVLCCP